MQQRHWLRKGFRPRAALLSLGLFTAAVPTSAAAGNSDEDGIEDVADNCPGTYNPGQEDQDFDGSGDVCDPSDSDGDGLPDVIDNCPQNPNADQADRDSDGQGDACEDVQGDGDGDRVKQRVRQLSDRCER